MDCDIPQWKKDLIARLRNQNKQTSPVTTMGTEEQLYFSSPHHSSAAVVCAVQQPSLTCNSSESVALNSVSSAPSQKCIVLSPTCSPSKQKMVQEKTWIDDHLTMVSDNLLNGVCHKDSDSDSSEDLHYGPGIVSRLKNKYLSLALRESNAHRPSILPMRKATSLENMLDDDIPNGTTERNRLFQPRLNGSNDTVKNVPNRYRAATRGLEMKRARSVEAISRSHHDDILPATAEVKHDRKSLHEDMLIKEGNDKPFKQMLDKKINEATNENNKYNGRINRPKRIQPIMNEREKPPVDVVKQKKLIFERRPESRTKPPIATGDVAAKVDTYNKIIVKEKANQKPAIKHKPVITTTNEKKTPPRVSKPVIIANDVTTKTPPKKLEVNKVPKPAFIDNKLISPIPDVSLIEPLNHKNDDKSLSETPDLILTSSPIHAPTSPTLKKSTELFINEEIRSSRENLFNDSTDNHTTKKTAPATGAVFNFANTQQQQQQQQDQSHLPINKNISTTKTPPSQPLKIEVNGLAKTENNLTLTEIEKNKINTAKTLQQPSPTKIESGSVKSGADVSKKVVPKVKRASSSEQAATTVFNFTSRKDVPDYIANDTSRTPGRPELPKAGEGGIILIPGATILDTFSEEDAELRSLEGPPSPCDVEFINDNILIGGKSSLSQKSKRVKMNISFVDNGPEVYEYPSENSLMLEEFPSPVSNSTLGHTVPNLSGSTLANYTPKSTEDFQLGVTRPAQNAPTSSAKIQPETEEIDSPEEPIAFSAGANSDILF